jgi:phage baseplate assembly protein W
MEVKILDEADNTILSRGWKFPPQIDLSTGKFVTVDFEEDIKEAIWIILMTKKGERVMLPQFGCSIHEYMFSSPDYTTIGIIEKEIKEALELWEPRIEEVEVRVTTNKANPEQLLIYIDYVVSATSSQNSLVYPLKLNE